MMAAQADTFDLKSPDFPSTTSSTVTRRFSFGRRQPREDRSDGSFPKSKKCILHLLQKKLFKPIGTPFPRPEVMKEQTAGEVMLCLVKLEK